MNITARYWLPDGVRTHALFCFNKNHRKCHKSRTFCRTLLKCAHFATHTLHVAAISRDMISPCFQTSSFSVLVGTFPTADSESNSLLDAHCSSREAEFGKSTAKYRERGCLKIRTKNMPYSSQTLVPCDFCLARLARCGCGVDLA